MLNALKEQTSWRLSFSITRECNFCFHTSEVSYRQVWLKVKDFSKTYKDYPTVFKDQKFMKNPDLSVKILLQKY